MSAFSPLGIYCVPQRGRSSQYMPKGASLDWCFARCPEGAPLGIYCGTNLQYMPTAFSPLGPGGQDKAQRVSNICPKGPRRGLYCVLLCKRGGVSAGPILGFAKRAPTFGLPAPKGAVCATFPFVSLREMRKHICLMRYLVPRRGPEGHIKCCPAPKGAVCAPRINWLCQ